MENNYEILRMPELKALAREHGLLQNNECRAQRRQMSTWEPQREPQGEVQTEARQPELEAPLTKRQLKHR